MDSTTVHESVMFTKSCSKTVTMQAKLTVSLTYYNKTRKNRSFHVILQ